MSIPFPRSLRQRRGHPLAQAMFLLVHLAAFAVGIFVLGLIFYILASGLPYIRPELFAWTWTPQNQSMLPALMNTLAMALLTLLLAVPVGVGGAIYLSEYARRGNRLVGWISLASDTLQGIPSIVFGLFGYVCFNIALGWGFSLLSGAVTLSLMILPLILRTTEEALHCVPDSYREGSFGLGAGRLRTVFRIVLPAAMPGILSGILLSIGRIVGESAALIFTAGSGTGNLRFREGLTAPLFQSARTLSVHMYCLMIEGLHIQQAQATAVVLLLLVLGLNSLSALAAKKLTQQ